MDKKEELIKELMLKVKNTQMTEEEYRYIASHLGSKNFLVFGTGHDSELWRYCNLSGITYFLEHDNAWIKKDSTDVFKVEYTTDISQYQQLLDNYKNGDVSRLTMQIPLIIQQIKWDIILVDSPPGWRENTPGRMQSIYMASILSNQNTEIFIHDCDRLVEDLYSKTFFSKIKTQLDKLRHLTL